MFFELANDGIAKILRLQNDHITIILVDVVYVEQM